MSLSSLLASARPLAAARLADAPALPVAHPACILFFSLCDGQSRALLRRAAGADFAAAWKDGVAQCQRLAITRRLAVRWLRVDWVTAVAPATWGALNAELAAIKRNYFRYGLAFDARFEHAFLEQELNANAMLYAGSDVAEARLNPGNFAAYAAHRFGAAFQPDFSPDAPLWRFASAGLFLAADAALASLPGGRAPQLLPAPEAEPGARWNGPAALDCGRRAIPALDADATFALVRSSSEFLARQVKKDGRFIYGHFPCFGRQIATYNTLRHASSVYSMLEAWELTHDDALLAAIRRALGYLDDTLIRRYPQPGGALAFNVDINGEIKLGANAVSLLALVKYDELTGDAQYRPLMEQLALGIARMQDAVSGRFVHVLNADDLSVKEDFRIVYYDGEAAFGLMRLYGLTRDARWLAIVERAFDYFLKADHWQHHDHWLSYCANELTRYRPEEKYFRFGVRNIAGHLDFIRERETTYPTLLELSMAFEQMLGRIRQLPEMQHVLAGLDIDKFRQALHHRAHYLLNGFFWPEFAMYFAKPASIVGSFFIRHHAFRVRIDDIEHYLSGYVAYWKMLERAPQNNEWLADERMFTPLPAAAGPVVVWGGDVNLGRRQHYRTAELGAENILRVPALREADLRIVNLECVIATQGGQGVKKGEDGPYYYRARPEMLRVLAAAGIDMVATANNHSGDYGPDALLEQGKWLDAVGLAHAGSGIDREAAFAPALRRAGNLNVALFSIDATQHRFTATADSPGSAHLPLDQPDVWKSELAKRIAAARQQAHVVLVAVHWGDNLATVPSAAEIAVGHALIGAGADAVLGASAHVLQGIEIYQGRPILYDAGDLLFDSVRGTLGKGGVFRLELSANGVERVVFVPVGVGFGFSEQLAGQAAQDAVQDYARQCAALGSTLTLTREGLGFIDLAPPARPSLPCAPAPATVYDLQPLNLSQPPNDPAWQVDAVPEDARIEPVRLGPLTLLGIRVTPQEITRRRMLWVESFWCCDAPVAEDVRLDIRGVPVRTTSMRPWGQSMDHDPCDWMAPTSRWQPGVIYRDYYGLRPPYLKDWKNVDLQITVGVVSRQQEVAPAALPIHVRLAVPGKDDNYPGNNGTVPRYRTEFPDIMHACKPGQTWTAEQLEAVTGGKWLVRPPEGWFVRSVVAGKKHIGMLLAPTLFIGHDSHDRCRHEQSRPPAKNFDRHTVIPANVDRLAGAMVRDSKALARLPASFPLLQVNDPIQALIELGIAARKRYQGEVIAVTGTAGKSTTVSMLQAMLGGAERVLASVDNYNSRVGAPAMLANLAADHEAAVIEVAQSALWMQRGPVTRLVQPTVALITEIGVSQTDARVKSVEDTAKWKSRIFDGLTGTSIAVVGEHLACFDDVMKQARDHAKRVVVFGRSPEAEVRIGAVEADENGSWVEAAFDGKLARFRVPIPGPGMVHNAVAAATVLYALGRDVEAGVAQLQAFQASEGRMQKQTLNLDGKTVQLIDDSFNATVTSMLNALSVFGATPPPPGRKIAVLGRIVHLGDLAKPLHESLAEPLLATGADLVVTHGDEMQYLRAVLPREILGPHFSTAASLAAYLRTGLRDDDLVLLKGSRRDSDFGKLVSILESNALVTLSNTEILNEICRKGPNDFSTSRFLKYGKGTIGRAIISDCARSQGLSAEEERGYRFFKIVSPVGREEVFEQNNPGESIFSHHLQLNKSHTKSLLGKRGFPVPPGKVFTDREEAQAYFERQPVPQVIKPVAAEGGAGVTVNVSTLRSFHDAWEKARPCGKSIIVEDYFEGDDVRILVVGGRATAALSRVPAFIVGDGKSTIAELIEEKNQQRLGNPRLKWVPIKDTSYLSVSGHSMAYIPAEGEYVRLGGTCNVSLGGENISILPALHHSIIEMAEKAAQCILGATLLGFDLLVKRFADSAADGNVVILEINSNPSIAGAYFASYGTPAEEVPNALVDLIKVGEYHTARRVEGSPLLSPAAIYRASCGGESFDRNYSTQMRLLRQAAYARKLSVEAINSHMTFMSDGHQEVAFFQGMCSRTRAVARRASNNKGWTKELLSRAGIATPQGQSFSTTQREAAWDFVVKTCRPMVVKPISGSGGSGISTEVTTREHFDKAWEIACATKVKTILVEEYVSGNDYRVFVIGNAIRAVTQRIPAYLIGDGVHSVAELLALKNQARCANPYNGSKLAVITPMIRRNLALLGIDETSVIEQGRYLQLHSVANIGSGGDSRDVTDDVHPDWAAIAAKVREVLYDPVHVGFDLIAEDVARPPAEQRWCVIEVNCNPDFGLQHFPSEGTPRDVAGALVEYLFPGCAVNAAPLLTLRTLVVGKVQGVGYRKWLWRQAHLHAVNGWVRNLPDGQVEAVLSGAENAVKQLLQVCRKGPGGARVEKIGLAKFSWPIERGFRILDNGNTP